MCGIVGMMTVGTATDKQLKMLSHLLLLDQMRGEHATGLAKVNLKTGETEVHKKAVNAIDYLSMSETKDFLNKDRQSLYIGHNRFATMGKRDDSGAHPFKHKHITMVHNGVVDRWVLDDLEGYNDKDCTVDSDMVCRTIAEKGIEGAVKVISGAFSLVWWDAESRSLNFLRNERRPMWICHTDTETMWASEKNFLNVLLARLDKYKGDFEPYEVKPHTLYSWYYDDKGSLLHNGHAKVRPLKIEGVEDPFPTSRGGWNNYSGPYSGYNYNQSSDQRALAKLKSCGLGNLKINDRVKLTFDCFERTALFDSKVSLHGIIHGEEGVKVAFRTFGTELKDILGDFDKELLKALPVGRNSATVLEAISPGASTIWADINACYDVSEKDESGVFRTFTRVVVDEVNSVPVDLKKIKDNTGKKLARGEVNEEIGARFPMKVDGWTFTNPREFINLTSCGCAACGNVPTIFNKNNKKMCVYSGVGGKHATIMDAEFVCGDCIAEDGNVIQNVQ